MLFSSKKNSKPILLFSFSLFHSNLLPFIFLPSFLLIFVQNFSNFLPPSHIFIVFFDFFFVEKNPRPRHNKLLENNFVFLFFFHNNETLNHFMTNSTISLEFIIRRFASIVSFDLIFQNVAQRKFGNPVSGVPLYTPSPRTIFLPF